MAKEFDDEINKTFEIEGESKTLIKPKNISQFLEAYRLKQDIELKCIGMNSAEANFKRWQEVLYGQKELLNSYIVDIGEFDNTILINNINYLSKKYELGVGLLERIIGLSAGYISRTAKEDSKKKMSIDVVWKIAKFFEVDLKELVEKDLSIPNINTDMLIKFVEKLKEKTLEEKIVWTSYGGCIFNLDKRYADIGVATENEKAPTRYNNGYYGSDFSYELAEDIYVYEGFKDKTDLALVTYRNRDSESKRMLYDFLLVYDDGSKTSFERLFSTEDAIASNIKKKVEELLDVITTKEIDAEISVEHRKIVADFLKETD